MDSKISPDADRFDVWRVLPYNSMSPATIDFTTASIVGFDYSDHADSGTRKLLPQEVFGLFESEVMDGFFMGMPNHGRSNPTSCTSFHDDINTSPALLPLSKKEERVSSDTNSSVPQLLVDMPGERRRAQNRAAQRTHRERQRRYVAQLEKRFFILQANYNQLDERYKAVQKDYQSLASFFRTRQTLADSPPDETNPEVALAFASMDLHSLSDFSLCEQELDRVLAFKVDETPSPEVPGT